MLKVHKKAVVPRYFSDCKVGETFMHNDNVCMKVRLNNTDYVLNLESGKVLTGIHSAMLTVRPIDAELHVSG
jgi:hypothetical protein